MNAETLKQLVEMADAHQAADEYLAGTYEAKRGTKWTGACAIGCTIRDAQKIGIVPADVLPGDHAALAAANGVPELVWRLTDSIFEGLPKEERPAWPPRLLRAIRPDADYSTLPARMSAALMLDEQIGLAAVATRDDVRESAKIIGGLYLRRARGDEPSAAEWTAARQQADAAWQQADAAWRQADAAWRQAYAARHQADAARRQAYAARHQAYAARHQADAAWRQAYAARRQAYAAAESFWRRCADILCGLLQEAA